MRLDYDYSLVTHDYSVFQVDLLFHTAVIILKIFFFLRFNLLPLARGVKSYIKDANYFLKKLRSLPNLTDDIILCAVNVVGLYPNIPHDEGLSTLPKGLDLMQEKDVKKFSTSGTC